MGAATISDAELTRPLLIAGHLRCFLDQPVAEIVQCGEPRLQTPQNQQFALSMEVRLLSSFLMLLCTRLSRAGRFQN